MCLCLLNDIPDLHETTINVSPQKNQRNPRLHSSKSVLAMMLKIKVLILKRKYAFIRHPVVDYLSLDIEGAELDILKTIPWTQVDIRYSKTGFRIFARCCNE